MKSIGLPFQSGYEACSLKAMSKPATLLLEQTDRWPIFTEESFTQLADRLSRATPNGQNTRAFSRLFYARAERVEIDSQGRIRIPTELSSLAGLTKEVVLIGVRDHLEIWTATRWDEYLRSQQENYDAIAEGAFPGNESD